MNDDLVALVEALESDRLSERLQQLYDQLAESGLTQSEIEEIVQQANQHDTVMSFDITDQENPIPVTGD